MHLTRYRVRTLLIAVGVLALLLGGGQESVRLMRLSRRYRYIAWAHGNDVRSGLGNLARLKPMYLKLRASSDANGGRLTDAERARLDELTLTISQLHSDIAMNANLVQSYEHAATHPWEAPPQVVIPISNPGWPVEKEPIIQRFLALPTPPPSIPPEFAPKPDPSPPPPPPPPPTPASNG
jgi:hypothetical protein